MTADMPDHVARARAEPVEIAPYDSAWPHSFAAEAARLRAILPATLAGRIEHVGSTSVPGLAGKPIVDMALVVPDLDSVLRDVAPRLAADGWEFFWRPPSPGDPGIDYAWFIRRGAAGGRTHHLHALPPGPRLDAMLAFRDRLRADPALAAAYAALKRKAASDAPDRAAYARAKGRFIRSVLDAPAGPSPAAAP